MNLNWLRLFEMNHISIIEFRFDRTLNTPNNLVFEKLFILLKVIRFFQMR